jgi:hypothetical protein
MHKQRLRLADVRRMPWPKHWTAAGFLLPSLKGGFPLLGTAQVELGGLSALEGLRLAKWIADRARELAR